MRKNNLRPPRLAQKNRSTILPTQFAKFTDYCVAMLLFAVGFLIVVILISYSPRDNCWFRVTDNQHIQNALGVFGAHLSDTMLSILGVGSSWLLVVGIFYLGYNKINSVISNQISWYSLLQVISFTILLVLFSTCEYMLFYDNSRSIYISDNYLHNGYGGIVGRYIYTLMNYYLNYIAIAIIVVLGIMLLVVFTFRIALLELMGYIGYLLYAIYIKISRQVTYIPNNDIQLSANKVKTKPINTQDLAQDLPSIELLALPTKQSNTTTPEDIDFIARTIENKLAEFKVQANIINIESGPVITRFELQPAEGVRGDKIIALDKEIARVLALSNIRIIDIVPGKNCMGIEVPNARRQTIFLRETLESQVYITSASKLTLALGMDTVGHVMVADLAKLPHLLVAGTTGSGKSVAINTMILSILYNSTPQEVKFILIDPKMVELSFYAHIPHLVTPVITDINKAANALKWAVAEMERRYRLMAAASCKNITSFNEAHASEPWAYIVIIIDELADLMMVIGKKIEQYIARIAQKARAVGIHLIVATQRPSVDVITGLIKANIPARISFQVPSKIDSRTILDMSGAEALIGQGDMLWLYPGSGHPVRVHGAFVTENEIERVTKWWKDKSGSPIYLVTDDEIEDIDDAADGIDSSVATDSLFDQVLDFIYSSKRCSISSLQTQFGIGYNRAAKIMHQMEKMRMVRRNDKGGFELCNTNQT